MKGFFEECESYGMALISEFGGRRGGGWLAGTRLTRDAGTGVWGSICWLCPTS